METLKMINFFDSIPKIKHFSHYGHTLDKKFKMNSLRYLIKSLRFKQEFHKKFLNEEIVNNKKKKEYDIYEMEGLKTNKENEEEDIFSLDNFNDNKDKECVKNNPKINKSYFYHKKNKGKKNEYPDGLKYNPNFNSISKNIPSVRMVKPFYFQSKKELKSTNLLKLEMKKNFIKIILKFNKN